MLSATDLKILLKHHGLRLMKRLGQHHLIDANVIRRVVDACELSGTETVVEIGAGLGALTESLASRASTVLAVEVDAKIADVLEHRLQAQGRVRVLRQDILEFRWETTPGAVVVGAIPYQLTSPILAALCEHRAFIRRAVLVMQREVAERLAARPGTKAYGRLSALAQYGYQIETVCSIPRGAFFPPPAVESRCVRLLPRSSPAVRVDDEARFFRVVKAAFAHRRKTLVNCLSDPRGGLMARARAEALLQKLKLPPSVRGEALSLEQFAMVANESFC